MSSVVTSIAAQTALLFPSGVVGEIFVLGVAVFVSFLVVLATALASFAVLALVAGAQTRFTPVTVRLGSRDMTFNELALLPLLAALGTVIIQAFGQFFGIVTAAARSIVEFIVNNPRRILSLIVVLGFAAVWLVAPQLIFPVMSQAYNCFVGPLLRIVLLSFGSIAAFVTSNALPLQNFFSHITKQATTSAVFHAVISASEQVTVAITLLAVSVISFGTAQTGWLAQVTPPGQVPTLLVIGPNFINTGILIGDAVYQLRYVTLQACAPLQPYVFEPLLKPFDDAEFAMAVNSTFALPYVVITQGILRPISAYLINLQADPGGTFGDLAPQPSFNSSIDTLNSAVQNWIGFADLFVPSVLNGVNVLLRDVTGLPLPNTTFPRSGLLTLTIGIPIDILMQTVKLTQNLVFQLIFNPDLAYSYPDGMQIWKVDEILAAFLRFTAVVNDWIAFAADYLRVLGFNFQAELTTPLDFEGRQSIRIVTFGLKRGDPHQYVTLATQGDVVKEALFFLAHIFETAICFVTSVSEAVISVVQLLNDLIAGTIYTFINDAFEANGQKFVTPFKYAQSLLRKPLTRDVLCVLTPINTQFVMFRIKNTTCLDYDAAFDSCNAPILNPGIRPPLYVFSPALHPSWISADNTTLGVIYNQCNNTCGPGRLRFSGTNTTVPAPLPSDNRYRQTLVAIGLPFQCLYSILSTFTIGFDCPSETNSTRCPFTTSTAFVIVQELADVIVLPINAFINFDRIITSTYFFYEDCFPLAKFIVHLQTIEVAITNAFRQTINALTVPTGDISLYCNIQGPGGNIGAVSSFIPCCILNLIDAIFGVTADLSQQIVLQLQAVFQAFLPAIVGGGNVTSYQPPLFTIPETWISIGSHAMACLPSQFIPPTLQCSDGVDNLQSTMTTQLGNVISTLLLVIPRTLVNFINGILGLILSPGFDAVKSLLVSIVTPSLTTIGVVFNSFGNLLFCLDNNNPFFLGLQQIGIFFQTTIASAVSLMIDLVFAVLQLVVGLLQLVSGGGSALIVSALTLLLKFFLEVGVAVFSQSVMCGFADAVCFAGLGIAVEPLVKVCNNGGGTFPPVDYNFAFCSEVLFKRNVQDNCFEYLADYGWSEAKMAHDLHFNNDGDERAAECYLQMQQPGVMMEYMLRQQKSYNMITRLVTTAPSTVIEHWSSIGTRISTESEALFNAQLHARPQEADPIEAPPAAHIDFGLFYHALTAQAEEKQHITEQFHSSVGSHIAAHAESMALFQDLIPQHESALVNFAATLRHINHMQSLKMSLNFQSAPRHVHNKRSEPAPDGRLALVLGGQLLRQRLAEGYRNAQLRVSTWVETWIDKLWSVGSSPKALESKAVKAAQLIDRGLASYKFRYVNGGKYHNITHWHQTGDLVGPMAIEIDPGLLPVIGLPQCDDSQQIVCTDCKYVDDLVLVSQTSFEAVKTFYTDPSDDRGTFNSITNSLARTLDVVLINPQGNDTYSTEPRSTLFITTRVWEVRWAWQWDYTEFLDILSTAIVDCNTTDPLAGVDIDQGFKDAFNALFGNLVPIMQRAICLATLAPAETATSLFERYVICDYDEALFCRGNKGTASIDGPQHMVDGFMNSLLFLAILGLVLDAVPGSSGLFVMIAPFVLFFGTLWIGYGASPFCALPGMMQMFGAYPVCAPMDLYGLLESTLAPSTPFPFALIDPASQAQYAETLITTCGEPPPVVDCGTVAGFTSIYDNIFFSTGVLFGGDFNANAASTIGSFSDSIRDSALKFTDARIAELEAYHNSGDVCNRLTFARIIFGLLGLAGALITGVGAILFLIPFLVAIALFAFIVFLIANEVSSQTDKHYVEDPRVQKWPSSET